MQYCNYKHPTPCLNGLLTMISVDDYNKHRLLIGGKEDKRTGNKYLDLFTKGLGIALGLPPLASPLETGLTAAAKIVAEDLK